MGDDGRDYFVLVDDSVVASAGSDLFEVASGEGVEAACSDSDLESDELLESVAAAAGAGGLVFFFRFLSMAVPKTKNMCQSVHGRLQSQNMH